MKAQLSMAGLQGMLTFCHLKTTEMEPIYNLGTEMDVALPGLGSLLARQHLHAASCQNLGRASVPKHDQPSPFPGAGQADNQDDGDGDHL